MNTVNNQPRYPCADAPPFLPMDVLPFRNNDIKVFWTDTPEGDYLTNPEAFYVDPFFPEYINNYSAPRTFPKRNSQLEFPRSVRFGSFADITTDPIGKSNAIWRQFVLQLKQLVHDIDPTIYFQWDGAQGTLGPTLPFDFTDPSICAFYSETLFFSVPSIYISVFATQFAWNEYFVQVPPMLALFPRIKTVFLPSTDRNFYIERIGDDPDANAGFALDAANYRNVLTQAASGGGGYFFPPEYIVGPDFDFSLPYIESVIRNFWSL